MNTLTPSSMSLLSWPSAASSSSSSLAINSTMSSLTSLNQASNETTSQPCRPLTASHKFKPQKSHVGSFNNTFMLTPHIATTLINAKYSRKVFVGGLPQDIDQDEILNYFRVYGQLVVDWPHKSESKSVYPPKGYVFLIFEKEKSVQDLMNNCVLDKEKYYLSISSASVRDKPIQIRPWCLSDTDYVMDPTQSIDPRKTIFVGGVPRPFKSSELAHEMERLYGGVCYAGIDTDPELKYPKGAARVSFTTQQSYIDAISSRFVLLSYGEIDKRAEIKPYVLDDQVCDRCVELGCRAKAAPYFCAHTSCLQYYCESCWSAAHSEKSKAYHKPLVKEGADRPRVIPFKWC